MSEVLPVAMVTDVKPGTMKKIMIEGHELLLAQIKDVYYCRDAYGPHLGGDLSQGTLNGKVLTCPLHHSQLISQTAGYCGGLTFPAPYYPWKRNKKPPRSLRIFPVTIEGDSILIKR
jgi:3-phenylpropionate/trans-cinnamate dioxygenase ferredoxin component